MGKKLAHPDTIQVETGALLGRLRNLIALFKSWSGRLIEDADV